MAGGPQLDVGAAIGYGWKKFTENVGPFIILFLAVFVVGIVLAIIQGAITPENAAAAWIVSALLSGITYIIMQIVQAGVWRAGLAVTRGEKPSVEMLTETNNIVPFVLTNIVVGIGFIIGFILCVIPGIIWLIFTAFASLNALDKGMDPIQAIKSSIDMVKAHAGRVILILIAVYIVYIIGACAFGIGLLVTAPVALVALVYTYRLLGNEPVAA